MQLYESDSSILELVNEMTLLFKMKSASNSSSWHYVSMQCNYCDCLDLTTTCKHIYAMKLILEKYFPHLSSFILAMNGERFVANKDVDNTEIEKSQAMQSSLEGDLDHSEIIGQVFDIKEILTILQEGIIESIKEASCANVKLARTCCKYWYHCH